MTLSSVFPKSEPRSMLNRLAKSLRNCMTLFLAGLFKFLYSLERIATSSASLSSFWNCAWSPVYPAAKASIRLASSLSSLRVLRTDSIIVSAALAAATSVFTFSINTAWKISWGTVVSPALERLIWMTFSAKVPASPSLSNFKYSSLLSWRTTRTLGRILDIDFAPSFAATITAFRILCCAAS